MDATRTAPAAGTSLPLDDAPFSLRPCRGRWDAVLARSTAALDAALRASLSADRGSAPLTRRQRAWAGGAALAGMGGIGALAAMAGFRPDLGAVEGPILSGAIGAAGLPVVLCVRRAVLGVGQRRAEAAVADAPAHGTASRPPAGVLPRLWDALRQPDRAARRRSRRQDRAVARMRADISRREQLLAERIASTGLSGLAAPADPHRPATRRARARGAEDPTSALPRDVADALADLEARELQHAGSVAAGRPAPARQNGVRPGATGSAVVAPLRARRHDRFKPLHTRTHITTSEGRKLDATVLDVSKSGVAVEGDLPGLWIGSMVTVGSRRAKAVRVLPGGMAFEFSMPVPAEALTAGFVL